MVIFFEIDKILLLNFIMIINSMIPCQYLFNFIEPKLMYILSLYFFLFIFFED